MKQRVWLTLTGDLVVVWNIGRDKLNRRVVSEIEWALRLAGAKCLGDL